MEMRRTILEGKVRQFEHDIEKNDPIHDYLDQKAQEAIGEKKARKKYLKDTLGTTRVEEPVTPIPDKIRKQEDVYKRDVSQEMFNQKVFRV